MKDFTTLGKLLLLCQKKACNGAGFENAGEWNGDGECGFLEEWENFFFGFLSLGRRIKTCDLLWKGAGIKPEIPEFGFFLLTSSTELLPKFSYLETVELQYQMQESFFKETVAQHPAGI